MGGDLIDRYDAAFARLAKMPASRRRARSLKNYDTAGDTKRTPVVFPKRWGYLGVSLDEPKIFPRSPRACAIMSGKLRHHENQRPKTYYPLLHREGRMLSHPPPNQEAARRKRRQVDWRGREVRVRRKPRGMRDARGEGGDGAHHARSALPRTRHVRVRRMGRRVHAPLHLHEVLRYAHRLRRRRARVASEGRAPDEETVGRGQALPSRPRRAQRLLHPQTPLRRRNPRRVQVRLTRRECRPPCRRGVRRTSSLQGGASLRDATRKSQSAVGSGLRPRRRYNARPARSSRRFGPRSALLCHIRPKNAGFRAISSSFDNSKRRKDLFFGIILDVGIGISERT